jgi:polar amino acid transport system permease protein
MPELWSWEYAWQILPELARAAVITIEATLLGFAIAAVLGLAFAILRMSRNPWIANPITGFIEFCAARRC